MRARPRAFTLIELLLAIAILGVIASIALPNFLGFACKARQAEAHANLSGARAALHSWVAERARPFEVTIPCGGGAPAGSADHPGFAVNGAARYSYVIGYDGATAYGHAAGCGLMLGDLIELSDGGDGLRQTANVCRR